MYLGAKAANGVVSALFSKGTLYFAYTICNQSHLVAPF
jgi:hypothetical protein